jgi:sugar O-acyltransferase (sialic acid O-acetyltransferase NeuD family)
MLVIGAKGFATQLADVLHQMDALKGLCFYDDVSTDLPEKFFSKYDILRNEEAAAAYFKKDNRFILGIGNVHLRESLCKKMQQLGGQLTSIISPKAVIGHYQVLIENGVIILSGTVIESTCTIGTGSLLNLNCTIAHGSTIGRFCELSPGTHISGECSIGNFCTLGTGCILLPKIKIGNNVTVGAGAVVTKNIPDNTTVTGIPAKPLIK